MEEMGEKESRQLWYFIGIFAVLVIAFLVTMEYLIFL